MTKRISPFTDFGFKYIFGQEKKFPRFTKKEEECQGIFDYWIYNIKNMETTNSIAFAQQHKIFKRLEAVTNYANLDRA